MSSVPTRVGCPGELIWTASESNCNWSHEQALAKFTLNVNETKCLWTR